MVQRRPTPVNMVPAVTAASAKSPETSVQNGGDVREISYRMLTHGRVMFCAAFRVSFRKKSQDTQDLPNASMLVHKDRTRP